MPRAPAADPSQLDLFESTSAPPAAALADDPAPRQAPTAPLAPVVQAQGPAMLRHPRANREACLSGQLVAYEFRRARRKSIGFVVGNDGLVVSAPRWVGRAEVDAALQEKARWILAKLQEQDERARRWSRPASIGATAPRFPSSARA